MNDIQARQWEVLIGALWDKRTAIKETSNREYESFGPNISMSEHLAHDLRWRGQIKKAVQDYQDALTARITGVCPLIWKLTHGGEA